MSTTAKRRRACTSDAETTEPLIPLDLLLDILERSDVGTLVRCAATCKAIRHVILGQDLRRLLALRAEANGGFDPALLLGVSYVVSSSSTTAAVGRVLRFDASLLRSYQVVASRDAFVVLQQMDARELLVCDDLTGQTYHLPPAAIGDDGYPHALLTVGDDRSFQLLAADRDLRTQTFSSTDGRWGPVLQTHHTSPLSYDGYTSRPIVLGSSNVHWLRLHRRRQLMHRHDPHIIALDIGSAQAARIDLPSECISRMRYIQDGCTGLHLATSRTGRLAVLVAEILVISMWTLLEIEDLSLASASTPTWNREVVIKRQIIGTVTGFTNYDIHFLGFGQRSGTVLLIMDGVGLVQLNLGSKDVVILDHESKKTKNFNCTKLCLHEINLSSLLQAMRPLRQ